MRRLITLLMALCMMSSIASAAAENKTLVKTSLFTIADTLLEDYFKVSVKEKKGTSEPHPIAVEGKSSMMNRYFKINVYRYTDDVTLGGIPVTQLMKETTLTGIERERMFCNMAYNVALAEMGLNTLLDKATSKYTYYGGKKQVFLTFTFNDADLLYAMCHNERSNMAYVFEIGRIKTSSPAQFSNETLLTLLIQYMIEADVQPLMAESTPNADKCIIITNSSANIRSGPGGNYAKITTGRKGDTFPLIDEDGNWYIIDVDGQTGYVSKSLSAIQE